MSKFPKCLLQRCQLPGILQPELYGIPVDRASYLDGACCFHPPFSLMEIQAVLLPGQTAVFQKPPCLHFLVSYKPFIVKIIDGSRIKPIPEIH